VHPVLCAVVCFLFVKISGQNFFPPIYSKNYSKNESAIGEACHQQAWGRHNIFFGIELLSTKISRAELNTKISCQDFLSLRKFEKPSAFNSTKIFQTINLYFLSFPKNKFQFPKI